jgi:hypothetical protein
MEAAKLRLRGKKLKLKHWNSNQVQFLRCALLTDMDLSRQTLLRFPTRASHKQNERGIDFFSVLEIHVGILLALLLMCC